MNNNKELKKQIISALCEKLGVKPGELFKFSNQKHDGIYFFDNSKEYKLKKCLPVKDVEDLCMIVDSRVSFNWLMDKKCKVVRPVGNEITELEFAINHRFLKEAL